MVNISTQYLNKILYLDSDILVLTDISECWGIDINKFAIAAVPSQNKKRSLVLNIDENRYFNSGVLLINLKYWRENNLTLKFIDFIKNHSHLIKFWDQDVLNRVCGDSVLFIDEKWNYCGLYSDENDVNILHFVGMHKPWSKHYKMNKNKKKYYKTLLKTPYWKFKYTRYLI